MNIVARWCEQNSHQILNHIYTADHSLAAGEALNNKQLKNAKEGLDVVFTDVTKPVIK